MKNTYVFKCHLFGIGFTFFSPQIVPSSVELLIAFEVVKMALLVYARFLWLIKFKINQSQLNFLVNESRLPLKSKKKNLPSLSFTEN